MADDRDSFDAGADGLHDERYADQYLIGHRDQRGDADPLAHEVAGHPPWSRPRLQAILDGRDPVVGRKVALTIQGLIVLSVVAVTVNTMETMPHAVRRALQVEERLISAIFLAEYAARIYAAPNRLRYVLSPLGLIDLVAVLPSVLAFGFDARALRAVRILRVFAVLKLVRYLRAFRRLADALRAVREELLVFLFVAGIVLYLCSAGIYWLEHEAQPEAFGSIPKAMWWAVVTLTTVGYGDVVPVTTGGKIFTDFILLLAIGVISVPTALVTSALAEQRLRERDIID